MQAVDLIRSSAMSYEQPRQPSNGSSLVHLISSRQTLERTAFEEGLEVIATGRLTTFPKSSKYQIVIEQIEPAGAVDEERVEVGKHGAVGGDRR